MLNPGLGEIMVNDGKIQAADDLELTLAELAAQILQDPLRVRQLGDRVYERLQQDLRIAQERQGRRF
jgi:hypothetical protein